jgi:hypothetical protein
MKILYIALAIYVVVNLLVVLYFRYQDSNSGWLHYYLRKAKNANNTGSR